MLQWALQLNFPQTPVCFLDATLIYQPAFSLKASFFSFVSCCPAEILFVHSRGEFLIFGEWFWMLACVADTVNLSKCTKLAFWARTKAVEGWTKVNTIALLSFYSRDSISIIFPVQRQKQCVVLNLELESRMWLQALALQLSSLLTFEKLHTLSASVTLVTEGIIHALLTCSYFENEMNIHDEL